VNFLQAAEILAETGQDSGSDSTILAWHPEKSRVIP